MTLLFNITVRIHRRFEKKIIMNCVKKNWKHLLGGESKTIFFLSPYFNNVSPPKIQLKHKITCSLLNTQFDFFFPSSWTKTDRVKWTCDVRISYRLILIWHQLTGCRLADSRSVTLVDGSHGGPTL